jgi:hypothetical protein
VRLRLRLRLRLCLRQAPILLHWVVLPGRRWRCHWHPTRGFKRTAVTASGSDGRGGWDHLPHAHSRQADVALWLL